MVDCGNDEADEPEPRSEGGKEGLAHGELVEAADGGCGDEDGFALDTVVSLVDSRRDDGAAMGTGDDIGRPVID